MNVIQYNDFQIGKPNDLDDMYGNFTLDDFIFWNTEINSTSVLQLYQTYSEYMYFSLNSPVPSLCLPLLLPISFTLDDFIFWNVEINSTSVLQLYQTYSEFMYFITPSSPTHFKSDCPGFTPILYRELYTG